MKIKDIIKQNKVTLSFEVFPPKTDHTYDSVERATNKIAELKPHFMSVTYGAGGGSSKYTVNIASNIYNQLGVASLAHLTCVSSTKEEIHQMLTVFKENNIDNVLALRGDIPKNGNFPLPGHYQYAAELIKDIKAHGDFCIGGACYPEGHVESLNKETDIRYLKEKVDAGCDFLTTQMFFDNTILYNYLYRIREKGITIPVIAGIMPVTNGKQIKRICELSGTYLPTRFKAIVDTFGDNDKAMKQAGIAYATEQIIDLIANGVKGIHVYSMNKPEIAASIKNNLLDIINS